MDNNNLQCLGDSFCSGNHFTAVTSNSTLLTAYPARLGMILLAIAHIIFTQRVILHNQELRKKINTYSWFVIQLILHPVIVGGTVYLANVTRNEWWGVLALPFVFNFGAEPMDLSKLPSDVCVIFRVFTYIHHAGPLLACLTCFGLQGNAQFALANALLYAHAWSLHTIVSLSYRNVISKQKMFYPYMVQCLFVGYYWCTSMRQGLGEVGFRPSIVLQLLVGPMFQYFGRWGLYLYIRHFMGYPKPGDVRYDAFEVHKQLYEITAFAIAAVVVFYM